MHDAITWNNKTSDQLGINVEYYPSLAKPQRKYSKVTVPGRNGDLYQLQDAYSNVNLKFDIWAGRPGQLVNDYYEKIASWLYPESEYTAENVRRLEINNYHWLMTQYDPGIIRLAVFDSALSIENFFNRRGKTTLTFDCRPERYLRRGFNAVEISTSGTTIKNPTQFSAKPFIKVYGSGNGTLTVAGYAMTIKGLTDYICIDSDAQDCFRLISENKNSLVTLADDFPQLAPGENTITFTGGITKVEITPRWWKL